MVLSYPGPLFDTRKDGRLLSYKTYLDTKPVLYQDRYCSLTDVLPQDLVKLQSQEIWVNISKRSEICQAHKHLRSRGADNTDVYMTSVYKSSHYR